MEEAIGSILIGSTRLQQKNSPHFALTLGRIDCLRINLKRHLYRRVSLQFLHHLHVLAVSLSQVDEVSRKVCIRMFLLASLPIHGYRILI